MKKTRIIGILTILVIIFTMTMSIKVQAAAGSFSTSKSSVSLTEGGSITFNIVATNCEGRFSIESSNSGVVKVSESSVWVTGSQSITLTAVKAGSATITISAEDVGDTSENEVTGSKTISVTVKAKSTNTGSGNSGSGSSGSGSQSGGNSTSTPSVSFNNANETMYISTDSSVNFRSYYSTSSGVIGALNDGDKVTVVGKATESVDGITWYKIKYDGKTGYVSSAFLTSEEPEEEKSNNNNLKSLTVGSYELTPEFSADVTEYSLTVDENVDVLQVTAEPEDETAEVEVSGNDNLLLGENTIEIKVTAEDETVKTYTINVTKGEAPKIQLEELSVEGYTLSPEFSGDVYSYTLTINDVNVKSLAINAKSDNEDATIEILGNEDLKLGENIVTILVKSEDEEEVTTYQIVVNIEEEAQEVVAQIIPGIADNDLFLYGGIGLGALLLIIIIAIIISKRRNRDDEFDTFDAGFAPIDDKKEESKENLSNDNINDEKEEKRSRRKTKKDLIDENFGDNVDNSNFDDDRPKRKSGKHF